MRQYRKWTFFLILGLVGGMQGVRGQTPTPPPRLFFTDLTSGPNTGGENNNGAFVTLYGNNFSTNPTVTVGGGSAIVKLQPSSYLWYQRMTIQLAPRAGTGNIVVTSSGSASNGLPFTVRTGNILFAGTLAGDYATIRACRDVLL